MIGTSLGPYKIIEQLGAGGMGEVYLGEDTRLGRKVAIKVLPAEFASDPERLARFEQEARAAAALNHPHIAVVHDVGSEPGEDGATTHFMVQEYLEGETLREPLRKGALPLKTAVRIGTEIAEGLSAAHSAGIVHRDLKPENVFVTKAGHVKLLDFGLAKLTEAAPVASADLSQSPTMLGTVAGQVMGTAGYMSPEQVLGTVEIDQRADVFAFGCVLYEMAGGRQPFAGKSVLATLQKISEEEPEPIGEVNPALPPQLPWMLKKCLAKEPESRYQSADDLVVDLRHLAGEVEAGAARPIGTEALETSAGGSGAFGAAPATFGTVLAFGIVVGIAAAWVWLAGTNSELSAGQPTKLSIVLPEQVINNDVWQWYPSSFATISPDGERVVFVGDSTASIYVRSLADRELRRLDHTEGARNPFFSADGDSVGFFTKAGELKTVSLLEGSQPNTVLEQFPGGAWAFGDWHFDNRIVLSSLNSAGIFTISADDASSLQRVVTATDDRAFYSPQWLPGSGAVLYFAHFGHTTDIQVATIGDAQREPITLVEGASHPRYLESGHLLFVRDGGLWAAAYDPSDPAEIGPATSIPLDVAFDNLRANSAVPQIAVSDTGTLVYAPALGNTAQESDLVWVERDGTVTEIATLPVVLPSLQLSPDNTRLALEHRVASEVRISIYDMIGLQFQQPVFASLKQEFVGMPVWSRPAGDRIYYSNPGNQTGRVLSRPVDESGPEVELFTVDVHWLFPFSIPDDGDRLAYNHFSGDTTGNIEVWEFGGDSQEGQRMPFLSSQVHTPAFAPNGRAVAYERTEDGAQQVYVQGYPNGTALRISPSGGGGPLWSRDGAEVFFQGPEGSGLWAAPVQTDPDLEVGPATKLFDGLFLPSMDHGHSYDVALDGQRFLMVRLSEDDWRIRELGVVLNWFEELKELVPTEGQ